jgi:SAM-dependent methyltransferase
VKCRLCQADATSVFVDLGSAPPSNSFLSEAQLNEPEVYYPLRVVVCDRCHLVQIDEYKKSVEIFGEEYVYFSSVSRTWIDHARRYANAVTNRLALAKGSLVIEVGSNDGYLLQFFQQRGIPCIGVEPTHSTAAEAAAKGIEVIEEFFGLRLAENLAGSRGCADLIVGNNVLAHVPDLHDFVSGLSRLVKPTGTITLEFPHLLELVRHVQFDTIYHEHFSYFSLGVVDRLTSIHGLEIYDVEKMPTHGGSLRVFLQRVGGVRPVSQHVEVLLAEEQNAGMATGEYYEGFQPRVDAIKESLLLFLLEQKRIHHRVVGYGAAAKGNTLLNYCGVRSDMVAFVADAAPSKQGKFLPGSHIPVVAEVRIKEEKPDIVLVLPWNIRKEITSQLSYVREWGGHFAVAVPRLELIS